MQPGLVISVVDVLSGLKSRDEQDPEVSGLLELVV